MTVRCCPRSVIAWSLGSAVAVLGFWRIMLVIGLPEWGFDERRYLQDAWLLWSGETGDLFHGEYLYSLLISPAFAFGDAYFPVVKIINILIVSVALLLVYVSARFVLPPIKAGVVVVLCALIGQLSIAGHAMTEVLVLACYWAGVAALVYGLDHYRRGAEVWAFVMAGAVIGIVARVSLFASPKLLVIWALWAAVAFVMLRSRHLRASFRTIAAGVGGLIVGAAIIDISIRMTVRLIDVAFYSKYTHDFLLLGHFFNEWMTRPRLVIDMLLGNLGTVMLHYTLPLAVTLLCVRRAIREDDWRAKTLFGIGLAGFLAAAAQAIYYTISVGNWENITGNIYGRYYFHALPILLIGLFYWRSQLSRGETLFATCCMAAGIGAAIYSSVGPSTIVQFVSIDNAEQWYLYYPKMHAASLVALAACVPLLWLAPWRGSRVAIALLFAFNGAYASVAMARGLGAFLSQPPNPCSALKLVHTLASHKVALSGPNPWLVEASSVAPPFNTVVMNEHTYKGALDSDGRPTLDAARKLEHLRRFDFLLIGGIGGVNDGKGVFVINDCTLLDLRDSRRGEARLPLNKLVEQPRD